MKFIRIVTALTLVALAIPAYGITVAPSGGNVSVTMTTGPKGDTGPIGPQGIQGPAGPQGSAGPAGPQGPQGVAGLSLNWRGDWANSPTGYVANDAVYRNGSSYRALNYSSGVDPATDTTYVHWYPVSIKGATGATGAAGATGATGPAGPQGAKGDKGDIGSTGPAGAQGPQGIQGPTGATGAPGATGATGATGPTGSAGPKGDKGDTGAAGAGVPAGGTTGQVLSKINGTDYNTQWVNQSGGLPTDSPTVTTKITAPLFESNASDGTHYIKPYNATAYSGTCTKGMVQTVGTPAVLQVCTADGTWAAAGTGGGTWGTITGTLTDQIDLNSALGLKAPKASPTFTGTVTLPITGSGNQCVRVSATGVVSGTGSDCGTTSGTIGGSTGSTDNAVLVASGTGGATIKATPVIIATDGSTITTAKVADSADSQLFRAAPDSTGAGFMGPATSTTTPYYLQFPATPPTNGQVAIFGTSASGTVNGVTANIIPVTYGTNGSGGSMVYPGAGVPVSTGSAWGTSLNITAISDSTSTTSSTTAASSTAVKAAYDLAATKGTGTVTAVSVATANGISGSSSGGATPALTIALGDITPASVTASGAVAGKTLEIDGHASTTLTAAQVSNTTIYNTGQSAADVALTLPTAAVGLAAYFTVGTAQNNKWGVRAGASDKIYLLAADGTISTGVDNGYARMTAAQVGQSFACWTFKTDAYDWMCKAVAVGTSAFAAN